MWAHKCRQMKSVSTLWVILSESCLSALRPVLSKLKSLREQEDVCRRNTRPTEQQTEEIYLLHIQSRASRGYKCNKVSNPAHRLTCKCALPRLWTFPLETRAISLCSCWVFAQILALFPGFPVRPRETYCRVSASTGRQSRFMATDVNHAQNLTARLQSCTWGRCPQCSLMVYLWFCQSLHSWGGMEVDFLLLISLTEVNLLLRRGLNSNLSTYRITSRWCLSQPQIQKKHSLPGISLQYL